MIPVVLIVALLTGESFAIPMTDLAQCYRTEKALDHSQVAFSACSTESRVIESWGLSY